MEKRLEFVNQYPRYIRKSSQVIVNLGNYKVLIQDFCYLPYRDNNALKIENLWRGQPRASSIAQVFLNEEKIAEKELFGYLKFSYEETPAYLRDGMICTELYMTSKENGEYMGVAFFGGFWLIGSKNVRMVLRRGMEFSDMNEYQKTEKYSFAKQMAGHFFHQYSNSLDRVSSYLEKTGYTMNCESCRLDSQHITLYEKDSIYVFGFTAVDMAPAIMAETPENMARISDDLGLPHVKVSVSDISDAKKLHSIIKQEENSEGAVMYVIASGMVVWAYKVKSEQYEFWRAVRETMKRIMHKHGSLVPTVLKKHGKKAQSFYDYCRGKGFANMPTLIHEFRKLPEDPQLVLMLKAPPGSGKTTLGTALARLLNGTYLDQDMTQQSRKAYHAKIRLLVQKGQFPLILGKSHHTRKIRKDVLDILPANVKCIFIDFFHPIGDEEWLLLACQRIIHRGLDHVSLVSTTPCLDRVLAGFFNDLEPLDTNEKPAIRVDVTESVDQWVFSVLKFLEASQLIESRSPLYYAIQVDGAEKLSPMIPVPKTINILSSHHVTLKYIGRQKITPELKYSEIVGKKCLVKCIGYVADDKCIALVVELPSDIPCANPVPHITFGLSWGTKPFYSNDLIAGCTIQKLPSEFSVLGEIVAVY